MFSFSARRNELPSKVKVKCMNHQNATRNVCILYINMIILDFIIFEKQSTGYKAFIHTGFVFSHPQFYLRNFETMWSTLS